MLRITHLLAVIVIASAVPACTSGDEPASSSNEAALTTDEAQTLDLTKLPPDWKVLKGTPPGVTAIAIPAGPVGRSATCPSGTVCLFQNENRGGSGIAFALAPNTFINLTDFACPGCNNGLHGNNGTWNDQMTSWENASGVQYCWTFDINAVGEVHFMNPGVSLQNVLPRENDEASGIDRLGC